MSALRRLVATSLILGALLPSSPSHAADVTVSAAASLRDAFTEIAREFERANPQHRVLLNIGASGQLLQQIARGAPVDVFAAADQDTMDRATAQGLVMRETRVNFARNDLVLAVPASTKSLPAKLADLGGAGFERITIGTPESVPAGRYAKRALDAALMPDRIRVAFTVPLDVEVLYPIAVVKGGGMADLGKAFVKFVASDKAQAILARFQFRKP